MKVILLQDVARIGGRFEVKDVPDGHALNFLIPKKLAEPATPESLKRLEHTKTRDKESQENENAAFGEVLKKITETTFEMEVESNEKDHLFKAVKEQDIAAYLSEHIGTVRVDQVVLASPIKDLGEHEITLKSGEQKATVTITLKKK